MNENEHIVMIAKDARNASKEMSRCNSNKKNEILLRIAEKIEKDISIIKDANNKDIGHTNKMNLSNAMIDRLIVKDSTITSMADGLREIAKLDDPIGSLMNTWIRPNGLQISRMRIPLGVIAIIYESRPNVTIDAAGLCIKAGNAVILRGGSEAFNTNQALASIISHSFSETGLPEKAVQVIPIRDRSALNILLRQEEYIDLIIPRGGEGLIRFVVENSKIPVLKHYKGVCHVYVDEGADLSMAEEICFNSKVNRPGVCNAMETLLVHKALDKHFLPSLAKRYIEAGVEIRGCPKTLDILPNAKMALEDDWPAEYLDLIIAVRVVDDIDQAIEHISNYSSNHTEAIVTSDYHRARRFVREIDSSVVLVNASTRFNDGNQLGLGAEIGISTSKLHAFGPMGIEELTTTKFVVHGDGQIRE